MKTFALASLLFFTLTQAHAAFPIKNGQMTINLAGGTGGNGGSVDLRLSYVDAEKKSVKVEGSGRYNGKGFTVSESAPLATLKTIAIYASGGDGYSGSNGSSGSDGSSGWDGNNGWDGSDGCPPSNGSDGSDGSDGRDGSDGSDGTAGDDGGNGGAVRVTAPADQSELLLLVKASTAAGEGGYGGSGGSGGRGGRGGTGGRGGRGGTNTCKNDKGELIGGPSGSDGRNGSDGRPGRDGNDGHSAPGGSNGRAGSLTYIVVDAAGSKEYSRPFKLDIASIKALDDNEDTVVSPGETVHIMELTVKNSGPMPTPTSQALKVVFGSNATLVVKTAPESALGDVIPGNGTRTLTFAKGEVVLQAPDKTDLIGKPATLSTRIAINSFAVDSSDATGLNIKWPVGISTKNDKGSVYFGSEAKLAYALTNVSSKEAGPSGPTTLDVEFSWVSKESPGSDVFVALGDGRQFELGRSYVVSDFTVPAKSTLAIPLAVRLKNSAGRLTGSGTLKVTLKLKDFSSDGKDAVDSSTTQFYAVIDYRPTAFNKTWNTTANKIECKFPKRLNKHVDIVEVAFAKDAKSDKVRLRISRKGFLSDGTSPVVQTSTMTFAPYGGLLKAASTATVLGLLNKVFAPLSQGLESTWVIEPGSCALQRQ